ncbi:hypothetical protein OEA41_008123 [Lepraria neglecta]|uniref:S-adenosyl-L-methionine-dependent methyltransferase n=1 Tax=Lepraria neglecta TaxID=209136 RepID=A0AAD9ZF77_9LECA|nr:hypothetical protein OEA41_008123 [Lepraria neglecta]
MASPPRNTVAIDPKYQELITIHDRDFQKYSIENTVHLVPVDEATQHRVFNLMFDGKLIFPPLTKVENVLDCGYGSASWAIEVAEEYPDCEVIGVDISPHMKPDDTPENFWPELDDINRPLAYDPNYFDLVQSRMVGGGINASRWSTYLRDIKRVLKPGGWVQMVECYFMCQSDNGSITDSHPLRRWSNNYIRSLEGIKDPRAPQRLQTLFTAAGFVEIEHTMIPMPLCGWSNDPRSRRIGDANRDNIQQALSNLGIFPFTRRLGMAIEDVRALVARACVDAANPGLKAYFPIYVCIGKKPGP